MKEENLKIPREVLAVIEKLQKGGHEAYVVGGCVRDLLLVGRSLDKGGRGAEPKDWDITTSAKPEEIMGIFPDSFYENKFLTVTVKTTSEEPALKEIEVTTFRAEGKYTDKRHPDEVRFAATLEEDLSRRDFTVNAMATMVTCNEAQETSKDTVSPAACHMSLVDLFDGQGDLEKKLIRAVGEPEKRFEEDALRMMRAVRLAVQLDFMIEENTAAAIKKLAGNLKFIAKERIRDEFIKIMETSRAKEGVGFLHELGLLSYIMPEIEEGIGVENRPRIFTIWEHNLKALEYGAGQGFPTDVRIAALLHDVGKPRTKGPMKNNEWTYYGHDMVGSRMAASILARLHFPKSTIEKIAILIRWHLFRYDPNEGITDSSIRRLIRNVGPENMNDLVKVRICDRMGMGVPKALPYRLRHFQFRVEKILREEEAPAAKMLKIRGDDIMKILNIAPGPKVGRILEALLQEIIDEPTKNASNYLRERVEELGKIPDEELLAIAKAAESRVELSEEAREAEIKGKYYVK